MTREEIIHGLLLLRNTVESDEDFEIFDTSIKALKQEPRWIPIAERLPKEHICDDGFHEPSKSVLVQMKSGAMHTARYWSRYDKRWLDLNYPTTDEVIAWMPLPEPYKAESEE